MVKNNPNPELSYMYKLKPDAAISYLENKGWKITNDWREMWEDAHAKAFTISKMTDAELLKDTKSTLETALKEGWSSQKTQRELTNMFKARGWWGKQTITDEEGNEKTIQLGSPYRVRTIYRQNIQSAYNAGRYKKQLENVDFAPYFQYICVLDESTRPEHRAMHGKVFRYDDPIWAYMYPPNGWGCRCTVRQLTESELNRAGLKVESSGNDLSLKDVVINDDTGETKKIAQLMTKDLSGRDIVMSTDAGWSGNVGKCAWDIDVLAYKSIKTLPEKTRDVFISELAQNPHNKSVIENMIAETIKRGMKSYGIEKTVTWFMPDVIKSLEKENIRLQTPIAVLEDRQVFHSLGDRKYINQRLTQTQFYNIYNYIKDADEIFIDTQEHAVVYVKFLPKDEIIDDRDCIKIPVIINSKNKKRPVNYVGTTGRINYKSTFKGKGNENRYKKVE